MTEVVGPEHVWHDFILGIHMRSIVVAEEDDEGWDSWQEASEEFYGEKYTTIYDEYLNVLDEEA